MVSVLSVWYAGYGSFFGNLIGEVITGVKLFANITVPGAPPHYPVILAKARMTSEKVVAIKPNQSIKPGCS
jgi:hypothetical protein